MKPASSWCQETSWNCAWTLWSRQGFQLGYLKSDPETEAGLQQSGGELLEADVKELDREKEKSHWLAWGGVMVWGGAGGSLSDS